MKEDELVYYVHEEYLYAEEKDPECDDWSGVYFTCPVLGALSSSLYSMMASKDALKVIESNLERSGSWNLMCDRRLSSLEDKAERFYAEREFIRRLENYEVVKPSLLNDPVISWFLNECYWICREEYLKALNLKTRALEKK